MITLKKICYLLSVKEALLLYKSKVMPYFDLGDLYYDVANKNHLQGLQVLQNKCLKIIYTRKNWVNTDEAHKRSNILSTRNRRIFALIKYGH